MSDNSHNQPGGQWPQGPSNQDQPGSGQAPYGQQTPYSQPTPYGQQPSYGQQAPYGQQPSYGQQAYGQPAQYDQQAPYGAYGRGGMYDEAPAPARSGAMGLIGLVIVIAATAALLICAWLLGQGLSDLFLSIGQDPTAIDSEELARDPRFQEFAAAANGQWIGASLAVVAGTIGWIVSIIATASRRGRGFGIMGIVVGVLAPILALITLTLAMWPAVVALS